MMNDRRVNVGSRLNLVQLVALSVAWSAVSNASEIYKWVSDDGVVHYSDIRPKDNASITTVQLRELNSEDYDPATDPYSILNQAKRMNESWRERVAAKQQADSQSEETVKERLYASPPYTPYTYYTAPAYYPVVPPPRSWRQNPGAARRQLNALDALDLGNERPESINSGVHRERVLRSQALPIVSPKTVSGL